MGDGEISMSPTPTLSPRPPPHTSKLPPKQATKARPQPPSPDKNKPQTVDGFNSLPEVLRMGRRKSALELQLNEILDGSNTLRCQSFDVRRRQQQELARAETIIKNCASMHAGALEVMHAVRFANKLKRLQTPAETRAARVLADKEAARARVRADLAKLQGMIDGAKITTGMTLIGDLWAGMLFGKVAALLRQWNDNMVQSLHAELAAIRRADIEDVEAQPSESRGQEPQQMTYMCLKRYLVNEIGISKSQVDRCGRRGKSALLELLESESEVQPGPAQRYNLAQASFKQQQAAHQAALQQGSMQLTAHADVVAVSPRAERLSTIAEEEGYSCTLADAEPLEEMSHDSFSSEEEHESIVLSPTPHKPRGSAPNRGYRRGR